MKDSTSKYEVRCQPCDVTFPAGQKRCIHCGGKTSPSAAGALDAALAVPLEEVAAGSESLEVSSLGDGGMFPPALEAQEEPAEARGRFGFLRGGLSLIWILLAVVFSLMRACGGGEG